MVPSVPQTIKCDVPCAVPCHFRHNVSPLGGGKWFVTDTKTGATHGHKASIKWSSSQSRGPPEMDCTCGVPKKMQLPCSHVLAVAKGGKAYVTVGGPQY